MMIGTFVVAAFVAVDTWGPLSAYAGTAPRKNAAEAVATSATSLLRTFLSFLMIAFQSGL